MLDPFISSRTMVRLSEGLVGNLGPRALAAAFDKSDLPATFAKTHRNYLSQRAQLVFFEELARISGTENLAFAAPNHADISDYGLFGEYVTSANTFGKALSTTAEMMPFHSSYDRLSLAVDSSNFKLTYHAALRHAVGYQHYATLAALVLASIADPFFGASRRKRIELNIARPRYTAAYEELFGCDVAFDMPELCLLFDAETQHIPRRVPLRTKPTLADVARDAFGPAPTNLISAVKCCLRADITNAPTADFIALKLKMSERTLRRRLEEQGAKFRDITKNVRLSYANELLAFTNLPITEIAQKTGYSDASHFGRAFKAETGVNPNKYRMQILAENG